MSDNGHGFLAGMLMGSAMGAMAALLLAPKPGRELRRSLMEDGERLKARANESIVGLRERSERALQVTKETARQAADGMREAADMLRHGSEEAGTALEHELGAPTSAEPVSRVEARLSAGS